jgi:hypothetical protein
VKHFNAIALSLATLAVFTASGCASRPEIRLDRNPTVAFSDYKTFAFVNPNMETSDRYVTVMDGRMREATRQELERRNYVYSERNPDLLVDLVSGRVSEGTLIVDLFDPRRNTRVWHGFAFGERPLADLTVSELFVGFPINRQGGDLASAWN